MRDGILVVGMCGPIGSGKSTAQQQLTDRMRALGALGGITGPTVFKSCTTAPMADAVKRIAAVWLAPYLAANVLDRALYGPSEYRETDIPAFSHIAEWRSVRRFLQWLGTDVARARHQKFWLEHWTYGIEQLARQPAKVPGIVLVPDVRFANEASLILNHWHGVLLRLRFRDDVPSSSHASETGLVDFDFEGYRRLGQVHEFTRDRLNGSASMAAQAAWIEIVADKLLTHYKESLP